jgi:hypothetical protein
MDRTRYTEVTQVTNKELATLIAAQAAVIAELKDALAAKPARTKGESLHDKRMSATPVAGTVCSAHGGACGFAKNGIYPTKGGRRFHVARSGGAF